MLKIKAWFQAHWLRVKVFFQRLTKKKVIPIVEPTETTQQEESITETQISSFPSTNVVNPPVGSSIHAELAADIQTNSEKINAIQKTLEEQMPAPVIQLKQRIVNFLDYNGDGKIDLKDAGDFMRDFITMLAGVLTGIAFLMSDQIKLWITSGDINWTVIMGIIAAAAISAFGAIVKRKWAEADNIHRIQLNNANTAIQTAKNLLQQQELGHQTQLHTKDLYYLSLLKSQENKASLLQGQLQLANDIKNGVLNK
jgi:predicted transcriptional regulator